MLNIGRFRPLVFEDRGRDGLVAFALAIGTLWARSGRDSKCFETFDVEIATMDQESSNPSS